MTYTVDQEQLERAREFWPKGSTVYTILRHVSRSGMQRTIGLVAIKPIKPGTVADVRKVDILHPNYTVAQVLGMREDRQRDGVKISGFGMDMGFSIAYDLGRVLYNDGYALDHRWL